MNYKLQDQRGCRVSNCFGGYHFPFSIQSTEYSGQVGCIENKDKSDLMMWLSSADWFSHLLIIGASLLHIIKADPFLLSFRGCLCTHNHCCNYIKYSKDKCIISCSVNFGSRRPRLYLGRHVLLLHLIEDKYIIPLCIFMLAYPELQLFYKAVSYSANYWN